MSVILEEYCAEATNDSVTAQNLHKVSMRIDLALSFLHSHWRHCLSPSSLLAPWGQGSYVIHLCKNKSRFLPIKAPHSKAIFLKSTPESISLHWSPCFPQYNIQNPWGPSYHPSCISGHSHTCGLPSSPMDPHPPWPLPFFSRAALPLHQSSPASELHEERGCCLFITMLSSVSTG